MGRNKVSTKVRFPYVIGDIHGYSNELQSLLNKIIPVFQANDKIVFLGDYIDRGSNSKGVIEIILNLKKTYPDQIITLMGNHEHWLLNSLQDNSSSWILGMEGLTTIKSYSMEVAEKIERFIDVNISKIVIKEAFIPFDLFKEVLPQDHLNFFMNELELYYEDSDFICTHSGLNKNKTLSENDVRDLCWASPTYMLAHYDGDKTLVIGHSPTYLFQEDSYGKPIIHDKVILMDMGVYETGILSAIKLPELEVLYN